MKSTAEHFKNCAEITNASKGSYFWKVKNLFTRTRETKPKGCPVSIGKILDSNADTSEHLRSTFFPDGHLHRNMFAESWLTNVEERQANLHQDYMQHLSTCITEEELAGPLKESQTIRSPPIQRAYIHSCFVTPELIQNCLSQAFELLFTYKPELGI